MSPDPESKRWGRTILVLAALGLLILAPLLWLALRMRDDANRRQIINTNEAAAIRTLEQLAAAEQLYFENYGQQYAALPQLVEAGFLKAPLDGDRLMAQGYAFLLSVTPKGESGGASFRVNGDPVEPGVSGNRYFYMDSDIIGIRVSEGRPATKTDPPRQSSEQN